MDGRHEEALKSLLQTYREKIPNRNIHYKYSTASPFHFRIMSFFQQALITGY